MEILMEGNRAVRSIVIGLDLHRRLKVEAAMEGIALRVLVERKLGASVCGGGGSCGNRCDGVCEAVDSTDVPGENFQELGL